MGGECRDGNGSGVEGRNGAGRDWESAEKLTVNIGFWTFFAEGDSELVVGAEAGFLSE